MINHNIYDKHNFILDNIDTRPVSVKKLIILNDKLIKQFLLEESFIDNKAYEDVMYRINRPINKYKEKWSILLDKIEREIEKIQIMSFHCTRLTDQEINDIVQNGLKPLDFNFTKKRLDCLLKEWLINKNTYNILLKENAASDENRKWKIFFFHCISTCRDEWWLHRLFRSWGGEAIYLNHEENKEINNQIRKIGKPCIIVATLDYNETKLYQWIAEKIIKIMLNIGSISRYDTDSYIDHITPCYKIITIDDSTFEKLTNYKKRTNKIY